MTIIMPTYIEGERITLDIPVEPTFELAVEAYKEIEQSRENLSRFLPWANSTTKPEHYFSYLLNYAAQGYKDKTKFAYIIRNKITGKFLGVIDLNKADNENKSTEIGYWLSDNATGHGYMHEAVKTLEKAAFENGFNRIVILNATDNMPSVNVAKNAGYTLEGVMKEYRLSGDGTKFLDANLWAKTKSQWEKENE